VPTSTRTAAGCLRRFLFVVASAVDVVAAAADVDGEATAVVVVSRTVAEAVSAADDVDETSVTSAS